jgi:hypothetical protein
MSLGYDLTQEDWVYMFKKINKMTISTAHRSFQWRWLKGVLYTNKDYHRFNFKDSPKCSFCEEPSQDKDHLLLWCPKINEFRDQVYIKYISIFGNKTMSNKMKLFGCLDKGQIKDANSDTCDLIIFLMNKYICTI